MLATREIAIVVGKQKVPDIWLFAYAANKPNPVQVWTKFVGREYRDGRPPEGAHKGMFRIIETVGYPKEKDEHYLLMVAEHPSGSTDLPDEAGAYLGQFLNGDRKWLVFLPALSTGGGSCAHPVIREKTSEELGLLEL